MEDVGGDFVSGRWVRLGEGGECGADCGAEVQQPVSEGGGVPALRDWEVGDADEGVLRLGEGDKAERAGMLMLRHAAGQQRQRDDQEDGDPGGQVAPAPHCMQLEKRQHLRVS